MLSVLLALSSPTAHAQVHILGVPGFGIEPPVIDAPADGAAYLWDDQLLDPVSPTFEFRHGMPTLDDPSPVHADTIALCAFVFPSTDCSDRIAGRYAPSQVFHTIAADDPAVNRFALGLWTQLALGFAFDFTPNLFVPSFKGQIVTYQIGACHDSPGLDQADWVVESCAFSEPRDFRFSELYDPRDFDPPR